MTRVTAPVRCSCPAPGRANRRSTGFTLVEVVVTIVIVAIIAGIAAATILQGVRAFSTEQSRSDAHYQAKLAVERMAREIRLLRSQTAADIPTMTATDIGFTDIQGSQVRFQLSGSTVRRSGDNGATWQTLASGITSLVFGYYQNDGVTVATAATLWYVVIDATSTEGAESLHIRTTVHPRNF
jgi:prepilin-type N-terminal cleavage/methylation domain-containing protein